MGLDGKASMRALDLGGQTLRRRPVPSVPSSPPPTLQCIRHAAPRAAGPASAAHGDDDAAVLRPTGRQSSTFKGCVRGSGAIVSSCGGKRHVQPRRGLDRPASETGCWEAAGSQSGWFWKGPCWGSVPWGHERSHSSLSRQLSSSGLLPPPPREVRIERHSGF